MVIAEVGVAFSIMYLTEVLDILEQALKSMLHLRPEILTSSSATQPSNHEWKAVVLLALRIVRIFVKEGKEIMDAVVVGESVIKFDVSFVSFNFSIL